MRHTHAWQWPAFATLGLVAVCGALAACGSSSPGATPSPPSPTSATISGTVTETTSGTPLSSATVTVGASSATTGADGKYSLAGLAPGQAQLTAKQQGHDTYTQTLTVTAGTMTVNVAMTQAFVAVLSGNWAGGWRNNTFGTSGSATMTLGSDTIGQTFQATLDLNGSVFGLGDPPPQTFNGTYTPASGATINVTSPVFGTLAATVSPAGQISGSLTGVPGGSISRVDLTGTATPTVITINYTITFAGGGGTATGVLTLNKQ